MSNKIITSRPNLTKIRRCLFGRADPDSTRLFLNQQISMLRKEQCKKWNYDFDNDRPILIENNNNKQWNWRFDPLANQYVGANNFFEEEQENEVFLKNFSLKSSKKSKNNANKKQKQPPKLNRVLKKAKSEKLQLTPVFKRKINPVDIFNDSTDSEKSNFSAGNSTILPSSCPRPTTTTCTNNNNNNIKLTSNQIKRQQNLKLTPMRSRNSSNNSMILEKTLKLDSPKLRRSGLRRSVRLARCLTPTRVERVI